jgi:hypothetical protein
VIATLLDGLADQQAKEVRRGLHGPLRGLQRPWLRLLRDGGCPRAAWLKHCGRLPDWPPSMPRCSTDAQPGALPPPPSRCCWRTCCWRCLAAR